MNIKFNFRNIFSKVSEGEFSDALITLRRVEKGSVAYITWYLDLYFVIIRVLTIIKNENY